MSEPKPVNPQAFESDNHINIDYHDKDGNVIDLDNKVKSLQEANPTFFKSADPAPGQPNGYKVIDNKLQGGSGDPNPEQAATEAFEKALGL